MFTSPTKITILLTSLFLSAFGLPISKSLIGGCSSTRFGCCSDNVTSCGDTSCFNCPNKTRVVPTLIGGCSSTRFGCCSGQRVPCVNMNCTNCPKVNVPTGSTKINETISNFTNLLGGCVSTRFGCCHDNKTACSDRPCSNCHVAFQ